MCVLRLASLRSRLRKRKETVSRRMFDATPVSPHLAPSKDAACSALARDAVEEVPVLGLAVWGGGIGFLFFQLLDGDDQLQVLDVAAGAACNTWRAATL